MFCVCNVDKSQMGFIKCVAGIITIGRLLLPTWPAVDAEESGSIKSPSHLIPSYHTTTDLSFAATPSFSFHSVTTLSHGLFFPETCNQCFILITSITIIKALKGSSLKSKLGFAILLQIHLTSSPLHSEVSISSLNHLCRIHEVTYIMNVFQQNLHTYLLITLTYRLLHCSSHR